MGKKRVVWKRMDGIVELAPHGHSQRGMMMRSDSAEQPRTCLLTKGQTKRLRAVLQERIEIHGRGNFPTITARLIDLIVCLRANLRNCSIESNGVKLNGGAASFVASSDDFAYADLDLIFPMDTSAAADPPANTTSFDRVRDAVFATIRQLMPDNIGREKFDADTLKDVYIRKMIKVSTEFDAWSLFSLNNDYGRCIELKFVNRMRRQFEFSVDSFQIHLDPLVDDFDGVEPKKITIESVYGDIHQAMTHLQERLIDTTKPEEIRGGGLLKYCHLLIRGYKPARPGICRKLERYMCSRFFIDFPEVPAQEQKLRNYIESHFGNGSSASDQWMGWSSSSGDDTDSEASTSQATTSSLLAAGQAKYDFLMLLHRVISDSTVCLMQHERQMTLNMVDRLAFQVSLQCYSSQAFGAVASATNSSSTTSHTPRTTLFYLPADANKWIPVV